MTTDQVTALILRAHDEIEAAIREGRESDAAYIRSILRRARATGTLEVGQLEGALIR